MNLRSLYALYCSVEAVEEQGTHDWTSMTLATRTPHSASGESTLAAALQSQLVPKLELHPASFVTTFGL